MFQHLFVPLFDLQYHDLFEVSASQFLVSVGNTDDNHDRDIGQKAQADEGKQEPTHFHSTVHVSHPLGEGEEWVAGQENRYFIQDLLNVHVHTVVWLHVSYVAHSEKGGQDLPKDLRVARHRGQGQQSNHEVSADEENHDVGLRVLVFLKVNEELGVRVQRSILFRAFGQVLSVASGIDDQRDRSEEEHNE